MPCNMIIIGYNEFKTVLNLDSLKYENEFWIVGLIFIISGQVSLIYSITLNNKKRISKFSLIGIIILMLALFVLGIGNSIYYGNEWIITLITSTPFLGLTTYYFYKSFKNENTPPIMAH